MQDTFQRTTVVTWLLWVKTVAIVLAVWGTVVVDVPAALARALLVTGVLSMSITVTWQVRVYTKRLCNLIRATSGLEGLDAELHAINGSKPQRTR